MPESGPEGLSGHSPITADNVSYVRYAQAAPTEAAGVRLGWVITAADHRPRTVSIPASTDPSFDDDSLPIRSTRIDLSRSTSCETLATESRDRPVALALSRTFAGAAAERRLLVEWDGDHRAQRAPVEAVGLDDDDRSSKARFGIDRFAEVGPPHVALCDHRSVDSRICRPAAGTNGSIPSPTSVTTRSSASNRSSTRIARSVFHRLGSPSASISKWTSPA
jgi:hypothetical protein